MRVSETFLLPKVEHYNYDYYAGVEYRMDVTKPVGERVVLLQYQGKPVQPTDVFSICMSNYRASGAGGYEMLGVHGHSPDVINGGKFTNHTRPEGVKRAPKIVGSCWRSSASSGYHLARL